MKTIKLIDLLEKIANGEDTPNAIKFDGKIFTHNGMGLNYNYYCSETNKVLEETFILKELNDEIEIIEDTPKEDKKIEEVGVYNISKFMKDYPETARYILDLNNKLNKIIDKINGE